MTVREYMVDSLFLPDSYGEVWRPEEFDCIVPNAFGRNSYPEYGHRMRLRRWIQSARGEAISPDVGFVRMIRDRARSDVEAFEELSARSFAPGLANCELADICWRLFQEKKVPILGDWEVMYALRRLYPDLYEHGEELFVAIWLPQEGYLATRGMLLEAKRIADKLDLSAPCVVARPEHIQRVYFLALKVFGKSVSTKTMRSNDFEFDPDSVQWWTRGKWRWLFYEMLVRLHHRYHGWV